jgi:hypothetical protein
MMETMSARNKQQKIRGLKPISLCLGLVLVGCILPIALLRSDQSFPAAVITFLELFSLSALGLIFAQLVLRR